VAPVLRQQIASGHKLRLLYLLGPQVREFDGDAAQEEFKFEPATPVGAGNCVTPSDPIPQLAAACACRVPQLGLRALACGFRPRVRTR
jgi:hypothetical protein